MRNFLILIIGVGIGFIIGTAYTFYLFYRLITAEAPADKTKFYYMEDYNE